MPPAGTPSQPDLNQGRDRAIGNDNAAVSVPSPNPDPKRPPLMARSLGGKLLRAIVLICPPMPVIIQDWIQDWTLQAGI